jgi:hypothetical protein
VGILWLKSADFGAKIMKYDEEILEGTDKGFDVILKG